MNFQLDDVTDFSGYITDQAIYSPESTFLFPTPEYGVTLQLDTPEYEAELLDLFLLNRDPHKDMVHKWRAAEGIRFTSVIKPRAPKGLEVGSRCNLRAKPTIRGERDQVCALTLVIFNGDMHEPEIDWSEGNFIDI